LGYGECRAFGNCQQDVSRKEPLALKRSSSCDAALESAAGKSKKVWVFESGIERVQLREKKGVVYGES
jgi:hypothetical protein